MKLPPPSLSRLLKAPSQRCKLTGKPLKSNETSIVHAIKAHVTRIWSHHRCKFLCHDTVQINEKWPDMSQKQCRYMGQVGTVIAVSCTKDGKLRGMTKNNQRRQYTRYYVLFPDKYISGFHSHQLIKL